MKLGTFHVTSKINRHNVRIWDLKIPILPGEIGNEKFGALYLTTALNQLFLYF